MPRSPKFLHDVLVLKVELADPPLGGPDVPAVQLTLQGKRYGELTPLYATRLDGALTGLDGLFASGSQATPGLQWPDDVRAAVQKVLATRTEPRAPIHVHLVKPYGVLRFVPWERVVCDAFARPVLMLPDFVFPRPREIAGTLDVALCGSAPLGMPPAAVADALRVAAGSLLRSASRRVRLHVFADADVTDAVCDRMRGEWPADALQVHDPRAATGFDADDPPADAGALRSPWLRWMRHALRTAPIDAVHFCCHGHLANGRGALLFAQSPTERSTRYAGAPVGAVELQAFLTQVGAWSTGFENLMGNRSPAGLRGLADEVAQNRPGPVLLHDPGLDPDGAALVKAFDYLYDRSPGVPLASPAVLLYCQPYQADENSLFKSFTGAGPARAGSALPQIARNDVQVLRAEGAGGRAPVDDLFDAATAVPGWVATTERFADAVQLRYQELARDDLLPEAMAEQHAAVATDTLVRLRSAVTALAQRRGATP